MTASDTTLSTRSKVSDALESARTTNHSDADDHASVVTSSDSTRQDTTAVGRPRRRTATRKILTATLSFLKSEADTTHEEDGVHSDDFDAPPKPKRAGAVTKQYGSKRDKKRRLSSGPRLKPAPAMPPAVSEPAQAHVHSDSEDSEVAVTKRLLPRTARPLRSQTTPVNKPPKARPFAPRRTPSPKKKPQGMIFRPSPVPPPFVVELKCKRTPFSSPLSSKKSSRSTSTVATSLGTGVLGEQAQHDADPVIINEDLINHRTDDDTDDELAIRAAPVIVTQEASQNLNDPCKSEQTESLTMQDQAVLPSKEVMHASEEETMDVDLVEATSENEEEQAAHEEATAADQSAESLTGVFDPDTVPPSGVQVAEPEMQAASEEEESEEEQSEQDEEDEEDEVDEEVEMEVEEEDEDGNIRTVLKPQTPSKRQGRPYDIKTPSPTKRPARITPSRSSIRSQGLPVAVADIQAMPASLRMRLVGWHTNDEDYGPDKISNSTPRLEDEDDSDLEIEGQPSVSTPTASRIQLQDDPNKRWYDPQHLSLVLRSITSVLNGSRLPSAPTDTAEFDERNVLAHPYLPGGYQKWEQPMRYAMKAVVEEGTGNCLILLGPRGVGKTMIVERSLSILEQVYGKDRFIPVRLNGLIHNTDRAALRSIGWQLKSQGFQEDGGDWGSNAATMTSLLRMLEPANDPRAVADKPIIIIVDEFDLFAQHPRQSFLYCLLDIVQGNRRKAGMGVIGVSARSDCLAILEKRVRSRCQSQVHQVVLENTFEAFVGMAERLLYADTVQLSRDNEDLEDIADDWNAEVETFVRTPKMKTYLKRCWETYGNTPTQLRAALAHMCSHLEFETQHSDGEFSAPPPDQVVVPKLDVTLLPRQNPGRSDLPLSELSILELSVCVAAKHMRADHENAINFELLYRAYSDHVSRGRLNLATKPFTRAAFSMAFDRLRQLELFLPHVGKPGHYISPSTATSYKMYRFVPWDTTLADAIKTRSETRKDVPDRLKKWLGDWTA